MARAKSIKYSRARPTTRSGLHHAFHCADNLARAVDRRMPEAVALATWLDVDRAALGLPDGDDFGPGIVRHTPLPVVSWRRVCVTIARGLQQAVPAPETAAERWLDVLASRLNLNLLERQILSLTLYYEFDERLEHLVDRISTARGGVSRLQIDAPLLALLLGQDPGPITHALQEDGRLRVSGLLHVDQDGDLKAIGQLVTLARCSVLPKTDPFEQLLGRTVVATLPWDAFAHLGREIEVAADLLTAAIARREPGVNILLYGPPGTGKTSFAATLADHIGACLRPVAEQDHGGGEPSRLERLAGLQLAQRLAPPGETVLLCDEAEDVFVRHSYFHEHPVTSSRVFMHRLLEQTPVPVIWTANDIGVLGPAVLRRMTMCLQLKIPGVMERARLWRQLGCAEGISLAEADAVRLARLVPAAPAVAATALRATRLVSGDADTAQLIVEGISRAVTGGRRAAAMEERPAIYDPALVNADQDLQALADALAGPGLKRAVSLLLSGPSGTGKSAWARHLADHMGLEVVHRRASDLLGPFVGQTEANIAEAFAEARDSSAFLIFDEADSLLGDRSGAVRNWEVSQVNEMLTWMEQHPLPFACTTNLPDRLDQASLRRFVVKLRFNWLTAEQARLAWKRFFNTEPPADLETIAALTPADFALVKRQAMLHGQSHCPTSLLQLLAKEAEERCSERTPIGFRGWQ